MAICENRVAQEGGAIEMTATTLRIVCMYCLSVMGSKDGQGESGDSHSICSKCWRERFSEWGYPESEQK